MAKVRVGLLGFGTVGTGVAEILAGRLADQFEVVGAGVQNLARPNPRGVSLTTDLTEVVESPDVDIVVEVMGGVSPTFELLRRADKLGKPIVTANKELVARQWSWFAQRSQSVRFEAAVAAGIPVVGVLETLLKQGPVQEISGILNGTTNFILSRMEQDGAEFETALEEAQALGYAEADPSSDIDGWDALYKIGILGAMASGEPPNLESPRKGIRDVCLAEVQSAASRGRRIKLVASWGSERGIRVQPEEVEATSSLGMVNGTMNAVHIEGGVNGPLTLVGVGAGSLPTASAVVTDLLKLAQR